MSQSDFSVNLKSKTKRDRQIEKRTDTDKETHNAFTDFVGSRNYI